MSKRIAVIGAGDGGLATACRLAKAGHRITVFEKLAECGGRNHMLKDKGFSFDMGPSFVLMPDFFQEVFSSCGERLSDYLDLVCIDPSYNVFYSDKEKVSVRKDSNLTKQDIEKIEPGSSAAFDAFIAQTTRLYQTVKPLMYKNFTAQALLNPAYWPLLFKLDITKTYWDLACKYFKSDKLRYLFTFEAMFIGVSPYDCPGLYSVISYADHVQKIFHPIGGMYQIPLALEKMAKKFGVQFLYNSEVSAIEKTAKGLKLKVKDTEHDFDAVVVNADYAYAQESLLKRRLPKFKYSCSVYLMYLGMNRKFPGLAHHNLFFAKDLRKNLDQIFTTGEIPADPSFYVHVPTVTDPSLAPEAKDIFYVLVPVPNLAVTKESMASKESMIKDIVFNKLNQSLGVDIKNHIEVQHYFYPKDFLSKYNIYNGATFGLAHTLDQSAFFRPSVIDHKIENLYYVGASTQPGGGVPVVLAGSRIVADLIG